MYTKRKAIQNYQNILPALEDASHSTLSEGVRDFVFGLPRMARLAHISAKRSSSGRPGISQYHVLLLSLSTITGGILRQPPLSSGAELNTGTLYEISRQMREEAGAAAAARTAPPSSGPDDFHIVSAVIKPFGWRKGYDDSFE